MEVKQKVSFLIGLAFIIIGLLVKTFYRSYIYTNEINDFGLADSLPSLFYVIGFSQLLMISSFKFPSLVILFVSLGSVVYEFKQFYISDHLDIPDIVASIVGGIVSYMILLWVEKKYPQR